MEQLKSCPKCRSDEYAFRSRKKIETADGQAVLDKHKAATEAYQKAIALVPKSGKGSIKGKAAALAAWDAAKPSHEEIAAAKATLKGAPTPAD